MPAHRKHPLPSARMVELLCAAKRELLARQGHVTPEDFHLVWDWAWELMVRQHAWPHATDKRRDWRDAMTVAKDEMEAAFLDEPTKFGFISERLISAAERMCVTVTPDMLPQVVLAAMSTIDEEAA